MSANKTKPTSVSPQDFLDTVEPERRREDGFILLDFFNRCTDWTPQMWGPSVIGYGRYAYKYKSGREGEFFVTGFSPRKSALVVYLMSGFSEREALLAKLGKHKTSRACLYINKLADVDMKVLERLLRADFKEMKKRYPD